MDIHFECPTCKQRVKIDDSAAGMQIECPGCHNQLTVPSVASPAPRVLPKLRQETPAETPTPEPALPQPTGPLSKPKGKGKGAHYRCNNTRCGATFFESQLLTQTVQGKSSQVCPKCRMAVTKVAEAGGFLSRLFKK